MYIYAGEKMRSSLGFQTNINWDPFGQSSHLTFSSDFESISWLSMRTHLPRQCGAERACHLVVRPSTPCPGHLGSSFLLSLMAASSHLTHTVIPVRIIKINLMKIRVHSCLLPRQKVPHWSNSLHSAYCVIIIFLDIDFYILLKYFFCQAT